MNTKVYILGAGASNSDGVPLMRQFIQKGLTQWCGDISVLRQLFEFIKSIKKTNIKNVKSKSDLPDEEMFEIACSIDGNAEIGIEGLLAKAIDIDDHAAEIAIKDFIYGTIEKASSQCRYFRNFVANKIKNDIRKGFKVVFISFNYDILLERALLYNSLNGEFSYMVNSFEDRINSGKHYMKKYKSNIILLKPHGSLNWALCVKCKNIQHYWFLRYGHGVDNNACNRCGQKELNRLLIAPVKNKVYNDIFESLWAKAEEFLKVANEIVIIGYSFPKADVKAREIIGKAIANNSISPTLTLVDKIADNKPNKMFSIVKEISGIDENHFVKVNHFDDGFEQFLKG